MAVGRSDPDPGEFSVHLLDMGREKFGDCVLCLFGDVTVLIDGGHQADIRSRGGVASIPDQLEELLGHGPPFEVSLLVVTHTHLDHIGCLPAMVKQDLLRAEWAFVADEGLGFGAGGESEGGDAGVSMLDGADGPGVPPGLRTVVAAPARGGPRRHRRRDPPLPRRRRHPGEPLPRDARQAREAGNPCRSLRPRRSRRHAPAQFDFDRHGTLYGPADSHEDVRPALGIALTDAYLAVGREDFARDAGADEVEVYRRLVSDTSADRGANLGLSDASRLVRPSTTRAPCSGSR